MASDAPARDTIFALSSGRPPAAIAVVRISGSRSGRALEALIGRVPAPRKATLATVRDPASGAAIDQALALWFPGPRSETGEDVAELQLHGGRAVIAAVLAALGKLEGLRLAEPGEFTRRAFEHGRIDLTQVEGLADLIYAETEAQRRQALQQVRGLLGDRAEAWRQRLIEGLALVEAGIDFADEGDVPKGLVARAVAVARELSAEIARALAGADRGERLRDGLCVVIAGPPNAGKSTLLNRLARREAAIVAPYPGTTRDVIEVHLDLGGYPINLVDTAGIREASQDPVEREGMRRARAAAARADLVLWVVDATEIPQGPPAVIDSPGSGGTRWIVINKTDLIDSAAREQLGLKLPPHGPDIAPPNSLHNKVCWVSARTGAGLDPLLASIAAFAETSFSLEPALVTRERQRERLCEVVAALDAAIAQAEQGAGEEIVAECLRHALTSLGKLTGRVDLEEILDVIFRDFCIGK
jgi:tRNA modification GTPase